MKVGRDVPNPPGAILEEKSLLVSRTSRNMGYFSMSLYSLIREKIMFN